MEGGGGGEGMCPCDIFFNLKSVVLTKGNRTKVLSIPNVFRVADGVSTLVIFYVYVAFSCLSLFGGGGGGGLCCPLIGKSCFLPQRTLPFGHQPTKKQ